MLLTPRQPVPASGDMEKLAHVLDRLGVAYSWHKVVPFVGDLIPEPEVRNPGYAPAYVMDICRTESGLQLLETNCINAAGFYAADVMTLAAAIDALG